jgi:hypothetical protein
VKYFVFNIDWTTLPDTVLRWLQANRIEHDFFAMKNSSSGQFAIVQVLPNFVAAMDALAGMKNKTMLGGRQLKIQRAYAKPGHGSDKF